MSTIKHGSVINSRSAELVNNLHCLVFPFRTTVRVGLLAPTLRPCRNTSSSASRIKCSLFIGRNGSNLYVTVGVWPYLHLQLQLIKDEGEENLNRTYLSNGLEEQKHEEGQQ